MAIATTAQLMTHLGVAVEDGRFQTILDAAALMVARHCGRVVDGINGFCETPWTHRFDGGDSVIALRAAPVVSVTSVKEATDGAFDDADPLAAETDYVLDPAAATLTRVGTVWLPGRRTVEVVYLGGYEDVSAEHLAGHYAMPRDLTMAVLIQAAAMYKRAGDEGLQSISVSGQTVQHLAPDGLLPGVRKMVEPFVLRA